MTVPETGLGWPVAVGVAAAVVVAVGAVTWFLVRRRRKAEEIEAPPKESPGPPEGKGKV